MSRSSFPCALCLALSLCSLAVSAQSALTTAAITYEISDIKSNRELEAEALEELNQYKEGFELRYYFDPGHIRIDQQLPGTTYRFTTISDLRDSSLQVFIEMEGQKIKCKTRISDLKNAEFERVLGGYPKAVENPGDSLRLFGQLCRARQAEGRKAYVNEFIGLNNYFTIPTRASLLVGEGPGLALKLEDEIADFGSLIIEAVDVKKTLPKGIFEMPGADQYELIETNQILNLMVRLSLGK